MAIATVAVSYQDSFLVFKLVEDLGDNILIEVRGRLMKNRKTNKALTRSSAFSCALLPL